MHYTVGLYSKAKRWTDFFSYVECFKSEDLLTWLSRRTYLRYHGRWIDSVWKSCSYAGALKEDPINLYIFWKLNSYRIQPYVWNFLKSYCRSNVKRNTQKHCFALTGSLLRVNYRSGVINIGNVFSHITLKKSVCDFPDVAWFFFYTLLKFDILNLGISFH